MQAAAPSPLPVALVLEDHPLVGRGICAVLASQGLFARVTAHDHAQSCLQAMQAQPQTTGLLVLDFWLDEGPCLPVLEQARQMAPAWRLLVISADNAAGVLQSVRHAGAHGFIGKHHSSATFMQAVRTVLAGGMWFPEPTVRAAKDPDGMAARHAQAYGLTKRQTDVLALMLGGLPNKRIARELGMSEATVKEHVGHILAKLGVHTRIEAIARLSSELR